MSDTGAAERAARAAWEAAYLSDGEKAAHPWDAPWVREAWGAVARAALAAAAPTVEQYREVLDLHDADRLSYDGYYVDACRGCDWQPPQGADGHEAHKTHQAEQVAALWGAR